MSCRRQTASRLPDSCPTLGAIRAWSDAVQSVMPSLPSTFPVRPDNLPKPEDVVANAYDFAEQLVATQRKSAEDVLRATAPPAAKAESPVRNESPATRRGSSRVLDNARRNARS